VVSPGSIAAHIPIEMPGSGERKDLSSWLSFPIQSGTSKPDTPFGVQLGAQPTHMSADDMLDLMEMQQGSFLSSLLDHKF